MKKTLITVMLTAVVCFAIVGTTLAWLMDKTDPITNTFTVGDVDIDLTETKGSTTDNKNFSFKMVPGATIEKDPTVTVKAGSENCWVFIKIDEVGNTFGTNDEKKLFVTYTVATGWTELDGYTGVYYRKVDFNEDDDQDFAVLADDQVVVNSEATREDLQAIASSPQLIFTAYAVQYDATSINTAAAAWAIASATTTP